MIHIFKGFVFRRDQFEYFEGNSAQKLTMIHKQPKGK